MRYNLAYEEEVTQAQTYLLSCIAAEKEIELKVVKKQRTLPQNSYLHFILTVFAVEFGYTLEEAKTLYKRINGATYAYEKAGQKFLKSSADLNAEEMAATIDKFMQYSSENGLDLPLATDEKQMRYYQNQIESQRRYL